MLALRVVSQPSPTDEPTGGCTSLKWANWCFFWGFSKNILGERKFDKKFDIKKKIKIRDLGINLEKHNY